MSSQNEYEEKPLYYYHLNKETGEITGRQVKYTVTKKIAGSSIILKFLLKINSNMMTIYEYQLEKVSNMGIYMFSFSDDLEAAVDLFKNDWKQRLYRQQDTINKTLDKYAEISRIYGSIC